MMEVLTEIRDILLRIEQQGIVKEAKKRAKKLATLTPFQERYCVPLYESFPEARGRASAILAIEKAFTDHELLKITGDNPEDIFEQLMKDVLAYSDYIKRTNTPREKVKMPQGWFNDQRYLNE